MKSSRIIIFFFLLLIVAFLSLAGRCFYVQFFKYGHYCEVCTRQQQAQVTLKPQRGVIVDCRGRVLAASNKIQTIFADPLVIEEPEDVSVELAKIVNMDAIEIYKLITESRNRRYVKIKTDAGQQQCNAAGKIYGIGIQSDWRRHYPAGELTAHIVGFSGVDNRGLEGIEFQYDAQLCGSPGENIFFADASSSRRPVRLKHSSWYLADGNGIILTIDAAVQQFSRAELLRQYESYECEGAVAIVAEPKTGAILAMVSLPDFEPNNIRFSDADTMRNRAVTNAFEPGSLLKPIAAAIAIDDGVVGPEEKIFCENGSYRGKGFGRIGEYGDHQFGKLSVREILVRSSNIGMAKIGQRTGKEGLYRGLKLFGFGRKTGIDLPGESFGLLQPSDKWTGYSVTRIPFGQEISVTAIQLVRAFCIVANGGRYVRPYLVRAVVGNDGEIVKQKHPLPGVGFVVKPEVADWIVTEAMVGVVNEGTGKKAGLEKWQVFGKTGTAQLAKSDGKGYSDSDYVASFVAGAPAEDPAVVVLVSMFKPNIKLGKGYTGGTVAAPVAGRILEKTLNYLEKRK